MQPQWPDSPAAAAAQRADLAACRELLRGGSRSFRAASLLLPAEVAQPAAALYAFCRLADDAIDLEEDGKTDALNRLRDRLDRAYAGDPAPIAADRAFAEVVARYSIPRALPEALLEGFAWDTEERRYETLEELEAYAARVAGAVGVMMSLLMGVRDPQALARAADLGVAMQLTNIVRDIGEDARAGRVYLPLDWLRSAGLDVEAWLAAPSAGPEVAAVAVLLLQRAETLYARAEAGIAVLPRACQPGIRAARLIYAEIGRAVERGGMDSVMRRAVVPGWRKLQLLALGLRPGQLAEEALLAPPLAANMFLVEAVAAQRARMPPEAPAQDARGFSWVLALFARLEQQDRLSRGVARISSTAG
jgi:phytoene synthase